MRHAIRRAHAAVDEGDLRVAESPTSPNPRNSPASARRSRPAMRIGHGDERHAVDAFKRIDAPELRRVRIAGEMFGRQRLHMPSVTARQSGRCDPARRAPDNWAATSRRRGVGRCAPGSAPAEAYLGNAEQVSADARAPRVESQLVGPVEVDRSGSRSVRRAGVLRRVTRSRPQTAAMTISLPHSPGLVASSTNGSRPEDEQAHPRGRGCCGIGRRAPPSRSGRRSRRSRRRHRRGSLGR